MSTRTSIATMVLLPLLVAASAVAREADDQPAAQVAVSMVERTGEAARYWPSWRGPTAQGLVGKTSPEGSYPDTWSAIEGILWKVPVPGYGTSSPIVWGDRIFLTTARDSEPVRRSILAYRRSDGELLWEAFAPSSGTPERTNEKTGWAAPTASTDGERVYAYLGHDGLLAVDFEGETVWRKDVGTTRSSYDYGVASTPLLYRDRLILLQDHRGSNGSFIAAYEATTGRELWRAERDAKYGWSSPVAVRVGDHDEIVVHGVESVRAYDPETGDELWHVPKDPSQSVSTPVVGEGMLLVSHFLGSFALLPQNDGLQAWATAKGRSFVPSPILYDGRLYALKDNSGILTCMEARTGEVLWQARLSRARGNDRPDWSSQFSASPVAVDGRLYFTRDNGETYVVKAGPEYELLHVNSLGERIHASPALVDGNWYLRTVGHLLAISKDAPTPGLVDRVNDMWRRIRE